MQLSANQIAQLLDGTVEGNPNVLVDQLAKIEDAEAGSLSFLANPKYEQFLYTTKASIIIVNDDLVLAQPINAESSLVRVKDAYSSFSILLEKYNTIKLDKSGIEEPSYIHPTAKIGKNAYIGAFAYIGPNVIIGDNCKVYPHVYLGDNVKIGNDCTLFSGVKVYFDCVLADKVIIHSGAVIGGDGFGFAPQKDGSYSKIAQIGNVIIEDDVEIGSNSCIDRATMGSTYIRMGVKLDNLIQLAHNVDIGKNTVIASQTGISGSAKIGESCIIGGQVGIVGHISIAKGARIQAKSGIGKTIEKEGSKLAGAPATSFNTNMRAQVVFQRLPELERRLLELERKLNQYNIEGE
jgi:UDP-3-O-[3-hydroxymyristoyl] glucosamine N-acyltransferase